MTNFEYFIWMLQNNEELIEEINSLETDDIVYLTNEVCGTVDDFIEQSEDENE